MRKRLVKRKLWIFLSFLLLMFLLLGCAEVKQPEEKQPPADDYIVYITKTGSKYHRAGCRYLSRSKIPIKKSEAIAQGYTPCSVCKP